MSTEVDQVENLLRRALKNHDAIAAALRTGVGGPRLFKAIDDMKAVKTEAAQRGCYHDLSNRKTP